MDCSPPGSSFHGISQARVLEWGDALPSKPYGKAFWLRLEKAGHTLATGGLHNEILEAYQRKHIAAAEFGCLIK